MKRVWFDMDGTIADLYSVNGWLVDLEAEDVRPYVEAKPLVNVAVITSLVKEIVKKGYRACVVTWGSKHASADYNKRVCEAKKAWLYKTFPEIEWEQIVFYPYGTNKNAVNDGEEILFDDEERNRKDWQGLAFKPEAMEIVLKNLR